MPTTLAPSKRRPKPTRTVERPRPETLADLVRRLGNVPLRRIRMSPLPGTATVEDVVRLNESDESGMLCELIDGTLVEKTVGYEESILGGVLVQHLNNFVRPRNLGLVATTDGMLEILDGMVRVPDASFVSWDRFPGRRRPEKPAPRIAPNLVAEVLSRSNTRAEMERKRHDCFAAGTELFWEIDPKKRIARVYTAPDVFTTLTEADTLDGGTVLPGFALPLKEFFGELDRHG